jgi:hypothetical protein
MGFTRADQCGSSIFNWLVPDDGTVASHNGPQAVLRRSFVVLRLRTTVLPRVLDLELIRPGAVSNGSQCQEATRRAVRA